MSGRTKPKKKSFLSKFPSFRKKKSSQSPDKDANANPQIPPHPDFVTDNDTFTQPTLNLNTQDITRVDNPNFKVTSVSAANTSTTSQNAKRPNTTDEYQVGSLAKRLNNKGQESGSEYSDMDCTIIVNASVQNTQSKTGNTNQALRSAFYGDTSSSGGVSQNGEILSDTTSKKTVTCTYLPKTVQTSPEISSTKVSTFDNDVTNNKSVVTDLHNVDQDGQILHLEKDKDPWQHKSNIGNFEKNKNDVWLSKANSSWAKSPRCPDTQHSVEGKESSKAPSQSQSLSQNETFLVSYPVLDMSNKSAISVSKDSHNSNNMYLLDTEHENKNRLTYTGNTTHKVGITAKGDAGSPIAYKVLKNTDLNNEEIELEKPTGSSTQQMQASVNTKFELDHTIPPGGQDGLTEQSARVNNNQVRKPRHESQSQSDSSQTNASRLSSTSSVPTQSTPAKQMPQSSVRHPQLSAVKGLFRSTSVESTELDSIASDDLMCDSRFMDDEMMGFDEESFLSGMADGPKSSILQTRLARNGRIRSQSFEVSSKNEDKVIDSRRLRSITMGASPPSKVYDSTQGGTIPEEPRATTNSNERSKDNHVGFSRLNRSLHLNLTSQLSFTSDEEVIMDANTFRHLMQDMTNMKTMLFRLKRVIQENNVSCNALTGSLPTSPITTCNPLLAQDNILVDLTQENVQLKTEINAMKKQIEETDKTVARLHEELLEFQLSQVELANDHVTKQDVGVQADLPIISYKVYKPSYSPRPRTFRTRSEVSRIKAAFEEYMRINGRKIPASYPSANPEQILPLSPTKSESPISQRKTNQQHQAKLESPKSPRKTNQQLPLSPENKLPKLVKVSPTEALVKPSQLQSAATGKPRQIQAPRQLHPPGKQTPDQAKEQLPRPSSIKSPSDSIAALESPISAAETNKPKSKLPQSRLPKSNTLSKLGTHPVSRNGNQTKSEEDINTAQKSGSCNQLQSLVSSNSKSKLVAPSKVILNKEENGIKIEKRYSDQTLEQKFTAKPSDSSKANEHPMIKQKSRLKLVAPGFISKLTNSSSAENISSQNGSHDNLQNGLRSNSQSKLLPKGNKSDEDLDENDTKKQTIKTGIKKPNSPKNERPLSGGMDGMCRIPAPKSRIARSTGIPSRKTTNQP